jgi:hypothetical protein
MARITSARNGAMYGCPSTMWLQRSSVSWTVRPDGSIATSIVGILLDGADPSYVQPRDIYAWQMDRRDGEHERLEAYLNPVALPEARGHVHPS